MRHATEEGTPLLGPSRSESPVRPRRLFEERRGCCSSPLIICVGFSLGVWLSVRGQAPPVAGARASPVLEPVSRDTADDRMRLSKHAVWHGQSGRLRALDLTILTSFVFKDAEFVLAWFEDIGRQTLVYGERVAPETLVKQIAAVTAKDLNAVAAKLLKTPPSVTVYGDTTAVPRYDLIAKQFA